MKKVGLPIMEPKSRRGDSNPRPHHYEESSGSNGQRLVDTNSPASPTELDEREAVLGSADEAAELRPDFAGRGGVYFVQAADDRDGLIKIGYASESVQKRLAALQTGSPMRLRLLGVIVDVPPDVEKRLHRRFASAREHGEWFRPTDDIRRLAAGEAPFLVALVTRHHAAKVLQVPTAILDEVDACLDAAMDKHPANGTVRTRYFAEDLEYVVRRVEAERVRRATAKAVNTIAKRIRGALKAAVLGELVAAAIDDAIAEAIAPEEALAIIDARGMSA